MKALRPTGMAAFALLLLVSSLRAQEVPPAARVVLDVVNRLLGVIEPPADARPRTFTTQLRLSRAQGLPAAAQGAVIDLAYQYPDRLRLVGHVAGQTYSAGRDGREIWIHIPSRKFGVVGAPGLLKFSADPDSIDGTRLRPFRSPISKWQLTTTLMLMQPRSQAVEQVAGETCRIISMTPPELLIQAIGLPSARLEVAARQRDNLPVRLRLTDGGNLDVQLDLIDPKFIAPLEPAQWQIDAKTDETVERVALSHLTNFLDVAAALMHNKIPTLGPSRGQRNVIASVGQGRLEDWDGARVLFLKGTPEAMGRQHGALLQKEVRDCMRKILYGVGVGSSFEKGQWFFGEIERAQARLDKFVDPRFTAEMDAIARATGLHPQEMRLANFFPELFHCTGFALAGAATVDGRLYHGRVLDYLRGVGLEQNAVVTVYQPDEGNAWVNVGYAGFVGSVTGMNEKGISIGEMGGRGEGNWDGKPMAQLVREVMEKASTLDQAVEIMRRSPRTCEYYYVIADGKTRKAVGIEATPDTFTTVAMGESHPKLPRPVKDTVLLSAGDRYETLVNRVQESFGKLDVDGALGLMSRPVCMTSNIHSALFCPETLDFWVANADSTHVASEARFTHYNLAALLSK